MSRRLRCQHPPREHLLDDLALRSPDFFADYSRIQFYSDATVGVTHHVLRRLHVVVNSNTFRFATLLGVLALLGLTS